MSPVFRHGRLRLYLLKLLDEAPRHGYEVIRLLQDRFLGVYSPSPGTIYPRLARLEEEGLVTHDEVDGKKVYRITEKGRDEIHARVDDLADLEEELTESVRDIAREISQDVRETVRNLREELTWVARDVRREGRQARDRDRERHQSEAGQPPEAGPEAGQQPRSGQPTAGRPSGVGQPSEPHWDDEWDPASGEPPRDPQQAQPITDPEFIEAIVEDARNEAARDEARRARQFDRDAELNDWIRSQDDQDSRDAGKGPGHPHWTGHSFRDEDTTEDPAREEARRARENARRAREDMRDWFRAQRGGRRDRGDWPRPDWAAWANWQDWADRLGGAGQASRTAGARGGRGPVRAGRPGPRFFRDLEHMAIDFARELREAASHAEHIGEQGLGELWEILEESLTRIRDEVFGADAARPAGEDAKPAAGQAEAHGQKAGSGHESAGSRPESAGAGGEPSAPGDESADPARPEPEAGRDG
jgi:DNA-binding PadR family transcriptional regulator